MRTSGIGVRTGPVAARIRSAVPAVISGVALHYAQHPVLEDDAFADFHVRVDAPSGLRRWFEPQVLFSIDGERPFTPLPRNQGFPMLEWGLNFCVSALCDQYLTMHAAVLERDGLAVMLPAPSGSGKSTLCAGLAFNGWRLLSDELAVLQPESGLLLPLPRPISLKNQSIDVIRAFAPQAVFSPPVTDTIKGTVSHVRPPASALSQVDERVQPRWVILPKYVAGAPAQLMPLPKASAFVALMGQTFNYNVHGREGFRLLADLIEACDTYEFTYSSLHEAMAVFDELHRSTLNARL